MQSIITVIKRDGSEQVFNESKIRNAVRRAMRACGYDADGIVNAVVNKVSDNVYSGITVEKIQDIVEEKLMEYNAKIAKEYILYREKKRRIREEKGRLLGKKGSDLTDLEKKLSLNSIRVYVNRYKREGESLDEMFARVSMIYSGIRDYWYATEFIPNTPTIFNAMLSRSLSACFVLPVADDSGSIMDEAKLAAEIYRHGGGVGCNYSKIREKGALIKSSGRYASGPVSFMRIVDTVTDVFKSAGNRRGANIAILDMDHPDVREFIFCKTRAGMYENFNISVMTDYRLFGDGYVDLISRLDGTIVDSVKASDLLNDIAYAAWKSAEPGLLFKDNANEYNVMREHLGEVAATNPCGEQFLYPYESCNLGSIDLSKFVGKEGLDKDRLERCVRAAVRYLEAVIDWNCYVHGKIKDMTLDLRRIGLGVMGYADMLFKLGIKYSESVGVARWLSELISYWSMDESVELAKERSRGPFWLFDKSTYVSGELPFDYKDGLMAWDELISKIKKYGIRHVTTNTVAPTGTISMLADCSSGIEPVFTLAYVKHLPDAGGDYLYFNKIFEQAIAGREDRDKIKEMAMRGESVTDIAGLERFETARDISWKTHIDIQAAWQKYIGASISKTINLVESATVEDVKNAYKYAHEQGCKGITVYRDKSRESQVITCVNC